MTSHERHLLAARKTKLCGGLVPIAEAISKEPSGQAASHGPSGRPGELARRKSCSFTRLGDGSASDAS